MSNDQSRLYPGDFVPRPLTRSGDSRNPGVSRTFSYSVLVELTEQNNNREKSLGKWTVEDTPTVNNNVPLTATSSGYHYEVHFDVV